MRTQRSSSCEEENLINSYNKLMGDLDYHNWLAGLHSNKIRGNKVVLATFPTFTGYGYVYNNKETDNDRVEGEVQLLTADLIRAGLKFAISMPT
ncbi:hypothetical protein TNCV_2172841 [Trichonephila clavipes]|nr:hypothetical protein TNCV_2172841 [Trichonephila clavipes]